MENRRPVSALGAGELGALMFEPLRRLLERLPNDRLPRHEELNALASEAVTSGGGAPIRFVPPATPSRDFDAQYEIRVFRTGEVPTRPDSWHDVFNALVWLTFPRTKAVLNAHHTAQILSRRGDRERGTARDVLTLFDEGGLIVASASETLSELLQSFRWKALFWDRRDEVKRSMRFVIFGHAIYEKALSPYKGVTAKALIVPIGSDLLEAPLEAQIKVLDAYAAAHFSREEALVSTRSLPPLPILGIPRWDPRNEEPSYYDDETQFRPGYTRRG